MHLIKAGRKRRKSGFRHAVKPHDNVQVLVIEEGSLNIVTEGRSLSARRGSAIYLHPRSRYVMQCPSGTGYTGLFVTAKVTEPVGGARTCVMRCDAAIRQLTAEINRELRHPPLVGHVSIGHDASDDPDMLGALYGLLLLRIMRRASDASSAPPDPGAWSQLVQRRILANLYTDATVDELLEDLPLSPRQLRRHFRAQENMTVKQYQLRQKIAEAVRLLGDAELSITTIAMELGFTSSQHFATCFRVVTGSTPSAYRTRLGKSDFRSESR